MLVYDITQEKTFDNIAKWLRNIQEHANEGVERCILANKCDLNDKRMVSKEKGEGIARENGIRFFETSAKESINVEEAFMTLTRDILRKHQAGDSGENPTSNVNINRDGNKASSGSCCN